MEAYIRFATTDEERAAVYRMRYELYVEDQGLFQHEADHDRRWLTDEYDANSHIVLAEIDGVVVGTTRITWGADVPFTRETHETYDFKRFMGIVSERDVVIGTRLLVREKYRNSMLVFQLLWHGFEFCGRHNVELILGNCETHLVNRYYKLGFRPYGELYNHPTNGLLVPLAVVSGDLEYLRQIESPMLVPLGLRTKASDLVEPLRRLVTEHVAVKSEQYTDPGDYSSEVLHWLDDPDEGLRAMSGELSRDDALVLLAKSLILSCPRGNRLIIKGHASRTLYVLLSGSLEVQDDGALIARVDKRGSVIGEVAFFSGRRRMSDVIAGPDGARVLALSDDTLRRLISSHGPTAAKFLLHVTRGLCDKLQERASFETSGETAGETSGPG